MLENFIYAKQKSLFEEALNNGEVLDEAIVFIEDTKEIWNHGTYFSGKSVNLSDIESSIQSILEELGLDELNAILVDTGDAAFDPVINDYVSSTELLDTLTDYATKSEIPTTTSQLTNDSGFITDVSNKQDVIDDLAIIRSGASAGATAVQPSSLSAVATSGNYNDLSNKPAIPSAVTESTVSDWGFTKNSGTITGITMNGESKGNSGIVDLGTVITSHQDISGKQDKLVSGTNIKTVNGTSLLGSGNISISGGSSSAYPQVNHEATSDVVTITPNVLHVWDVVESLEITLDGVVDGVANEFVFQFKTGETNPTITLPDGIKWANDETPVFDVYELVQISVLNGLGAVIRSPYIEINKAIITYDGEQDMLKLAFDHPVASNITCSAVFVNGVELAFTVYKDEQYSYVENPFDVSGVYDFVITFSPQQDDVYVYKQGNTEISI